MKQRAWRASRPSSLEEPTGIIVRSEPAQTLVRLRWEPKAVLARIGEKRRYDYFPSVVHPFRGLLAIGFARAGALSVNLATLAAFPHCRDRRGRSAGPGKSNHISACPSAAWPGLIVFGAKRQQVKGEAGLRAEPAAPCA